MQDFADHIDYAVGLAGMDHAGSASDFNGRGIDGWDNARDTLNFTIERVRRGCGADQIARLGGGNPLRVMTAVEASPRNRTDPS